MYTTLFDKHTPHITLITQILKYSEKRKEFSRLKIKINYLAQITLVILLEKAVGI